jgi:hypothetical protein
VNAVAAPAMRMILESQQRGDIAVGHQPNIASRPAISPVGAALGHMSLATKRHRACPAVTSLYVKLSLIDES